MLWNPEWDFKVNTLLNFLLHVTTKDCHHSADHIAVMATMMWPQNENVSVAESGSHIWIAAHWVQEGSNVRYCNRCWWLDLIQQRHRYHFPPIINTRTSTDNQGTLCQLPNTNAMGVATVMNDMCPWAPDWVHVCMVCWYLLRTRRKTTQPSWLWVRAWTTLSVQTDGGGLLHCINSKRWRVTMDNTEPRTLPHVYSPSK